MWRRHRQDTPLFKAGRTDTRTRHPLTQGRASTAVAGAELPRGNTALCLPSSLRRYVVTCVFCIGRKAGGPARPSSKPFRRELEAGSSSQTWNDSEASNAMASKMQLAE